MVLVLLDGVRSVSVIILSRYKVHIQKVCVIIIT